MRKIIEIRGGRRGNYLFKKIKHIRKWRKSVLFLRGGVEEDVAQCTYG